LPPNLFGKIFTLQLVFIFFYLAPNFIIAILAVQLVLIFFRHLSVNRLCVGRPTVALLFLVHHRVSDSICLLLV
jgi:hypothetical protein